MNLTALGHQLRSRKEESEKVSLKLEGADGSRRSQGLLVDLAPGFRYPGHPCGFPQDSRSEDHSESTLWIAMVAIVLSKRGPRDWTTDLRGIHRAF